MAKQGPLPRKNLPWKELFRDPQQKPTSQTLLLKQPTLSPNPCWLHHDAKRRKAQELLHHAAKESRNEDCRAFMACLKACAKSKDLRRGAELHANLLGKGLLARHPRIGSALIHMYCRCGDLSKAEKVLADLPFRDVVSWSALISGYAQHGHGHSALRCFEKMQDEGLHPDEITLSCTLKACGIAGALRKGVIVHEEIARRGFLRKNIVLGNALVDMYAKCGDLGKAKDVLEDLPRRDVISWNSIILGYAQLGRGHESYRCLEKMQREDISPNSVTFIGILQGCGSLRDGKKGIKIHEEIVGRGLFGEDVVMLGTALIDMYVNCGMLAKAKEVLGELPNRNTVCWNALLTGYVQEGMFCETLLCFEKMQSEGLGPDPVTCICILKACASTRALNKGQQIHDYVADKGWLEKDIMLGTALVDMYAKCGMLEKARETLLELHIRDVGAWNALVDGYASQGKCQEALDCVTSMRTEGASPDAITFTCVLKACTNTGSAEKGIRVHNEIVSMSLPLEDSLLGTALVEMYAKCGMLARARDVLEGLPVRSVVCWSVLIEGYAQQGQGKNALQSLKRMQDEGFSPNAVTILSVLSACSRSGLLGQAQILFRDMAEEYRVWPMLKHYTCMVLAFGCAGDFDKAAAVIQAMPTPSDPALWLALLGSCRKWANVKLGTLAFDQALQLERSCGAAYVLMADIFAAAGMHEDAERIEAMRLKYADPEARGNDAVCGSMQVGPFVDFHVERDTRMKEVYAQTDRCRFC